MRVHALDHVYNSSLHSADVAPAPARRWCAGAMWPSYWGESSSIEIVRQSPGRAKRFRPPCHISGYRLTQTVFLGDPSCKRPDLPCGRDKAQGVYRWEHANPKTSQPLAACVGGIVPKQTGGRKADLHQTLVLHEQFRKVVLHITPPVFAGLSFLER